MSDKLIADTMEIVRQTDEFEDMNIPPFAWDTFVPVIVKAVLQAQEGG